MKRPTGGHRPIGDGTLHRRTFFYGMMAFLMLPFMPVQFTSVLTAVVWIFSGTPYAMAFVVLGTFRLDSVPIYSGIDRIFVMILPTILLGFAGWLTIAFMFSGNLLTAYLFKRILWTKFTKRFQAISHAQA